jgi:hypothetical protein
MCWKEKIQWQSVTNGLRKEHVLRSPFLDNARCIGDRLVWAVRSNDLTHWTTRDLFLLYVFAWLHCILLLYIVYSWLQVHCVFFVVIWIFGVLCHFQQYHGDQFTKPGANPCHIGDRLVWAVRSNDLTHWTTRDFFFVFVCFYLITLCIIIYCLFLITGTLCIFCCNLNLNFWCFMPLSAIFQLYHGDQFTKPGANARCIGDRLVWAVRSNDLTHWTTWDLFFFLFLLHVFAWLQVHCVFFVVIWIWIFGVLCHFQQYFTYIMGTSF